MPYLLVVLLTENCICSVVLGEIALKMQSTLTCTPGEDKKTESKNHNIIYIYIYSNSNSNSKRGKGKETWQEIAVLGEGVVGADVAVNHTHNKNLGINWFRFSS